jgi:hypothetical protein
MKKKPIANVEKPMPHFQAYLDIAAEFGWTKGYKRPSRITELDAAWLMYFSSHPFHKNVLLAETIHLREKSYEAGVADTLIGLLSTGTIITVQATFILYPVPQIFEANITKPL